MKKFLPSLLLTSLIALTSCQKVSVGVREFYDEVSNIEEHQYNEASVKGKYVRKGKRFHLSEDFGSQYYNGSGKIILEPTIFDENISQNALFTYDIDNSIWSSKDKIDEHLELSMAIVVNGRINIDPLWTDDIEYMEEMSNGITYESSDINGDVYRFDHSKMYFYLKPFKIAYTLEQMTDYRYLGYKNEQKFNMEVTCDEYGYTSNCYFKATYKYNIYDKNCFENYYNKPMRYVDASKVKSCQYYEELRFDIKWSD